MPDRTTAVQRKRPAHPNQIAGAIRSWALTPDRSARTAPARAAIMRKYINQVREALPDLRDEDDILYRAEQLYRADMIERSHKAVQARRAAAEAEAALAELDATGLADAGSDGIDAE